MEGSLLLICCRVPSSASSELTQLETPSVSYFFCLLLLLFAELFVRKTVSLYSNFQASDIPDWVLAEGLGARERDVVELNGLSSADVEELRSKSPLYACAKHVNKESKVLIGLGGKDQRVPSFQVGLLRGFVFVFIETTHKGKTLYYCLKAKHVDVKVNFYPNELHGLDGANQEHWLRSIISLFKEATDV
jgi:hypothetical protein